MKNLQKFTNNEFGTITTMMIDEEAWFLGTDVAEALGYKNLSDAIERHVDEEDVKTLKYRDCRETRFSELWNNGSYKDKKFINESGVYALIFGSKLESAKAFKKWVTKEVLPTIRKAGVYITEDATEEAIDYQKLYGIRRIRKTFTNADDLQKEWERYLELSKEEAKKGRINNEDKIKSANIVLDALRNRIDSNILNMKGSQVIAIQELISDIQDQIIEWGNRRYGARLGHANKQLKEAKETLVDFVNYYESENFGWTEDIQIMYHPFSENCMYKAIDEGIMVKTDGYNRWLKDFPFYQLPSREMLEEAGIDFSKPIDVRVGFRSLAKFDKQNFLKAFLDVIFNYFQVDDSIVSDLKMIDLLEAGICENYADGAIVFQLRNKVVA